MTKNQERCDELLISLRKITRAIDLHSKQLVQRFGLTGPQMILLKAICGAESGEISSSQLASTASLSLATVSSILDRLLEKGYIIRQKSSTDRRKTLIYPTEKARDVFKQNPTLLQEDFIKQFDMLKDWEQLSILSSLSRIAEMMHAKAIEASPLLANSELDKPVE